MNIVRKLRGGVAAGVAAAASAKEALDSAATGVIGGVGGGAGGRGGSGGVGDANNANNSSSHTQLGLMHLKKLFSEYQHPPHPLSEAEKEDKLYNMLPLFCKVFGSSPTGDMNDKFWDILAFCHQVSLLMVSEISKRASNQGTVAASCAIAKFLEIENCEESSNGWMLLSTLNLLAAGDSTLMQVMSEASVPSTLVRCLYLFCDLPEMLEQDANRKDVNSDFTPRERSILLQKIFVQVLLSFVNSYSHFIKLMIKLILTITCVIDSFFNKKCPKQL